MLINAQTKLHIKHQQNRIQNHTGFSTQSANFLMDTFDQEQSENDSKGIS